jgi:methylisocitrate lyase
MTSLRKLIAGPTPVRAPLVLNPLMAKLAEQAGFEALYLGGGASGYAKVHLEANLTLTEMAHAGIEIGTVTRLPLILDAAAGWGDPMHMRRTIGMAEAAGFAAIEIEDQILPKRAHHHVGIEHMIPLELMVEKLREAAAARRDPELVIIGRTNGVRSSNMDDALRRGEAYRKAGADVLLLSPRNAEEARHIGERLGAPLMHLCQPGALASMGLSLADMHGLGFRILADANTALLAAYDAWAAYYKEAAQAFSIASRTPKQWKEVEHAMQESIGLKALLDLERRTVER